MEFKAKDIASLLRGVVEGDENVTVNNVSKIEEGKPHTLAFLATLNMSITFIRRRLPSCWSMRIFSLPLPCRAR